MGRERKLQTLVYSSGVPWQRELRPGIASGLGYRFDNTITSDGGGTVSGVTLDAPCGVVSTTRIQLSRGANLVDVEPIDLFHLNHLLEGTRRTLTAPTPTISSSSPGLGSSHLPVLYPPAADPTLYGIDARNGGVYLNGTWGANADYASTNMSSIAGDLRWNQKEELRGDALLELDLKTHSFVVESADTALHLQFNVNDPMFVAGILLRQFDSSGSGSAERVDGLVRNLKLDLQSEVNPHFVDLTWGQIKEMTQTFFGIDRTDIQAGIGFIPLVDELSNVDGLRLIEKGANFSFEADTSTTPEDDFTAITPASGDRLHVTLLAYVPTEAAVDVLMNQAAA